MLRTLRYGVRNLHRDRRREASPPYKVAMEMRANSALRLAPKFRVGGLAAELFPTPVELAAVLCACRDRELPFRLA